MATGEALLRDLKKHILQTMQAIPECAPTNQGVSYRVIEDLAHLALKLPAKDGWLTWSILSALAQEGLAEGIKVKNRIFWRLTAAGGQV